MRHAKNANFCNPLHLLGRLFEQAKFIDARQSLISIVEKESEIKTG